MVNSYSYQIPQTTQPQFLYVEQGVAKSTFPKNIQAIMRSSKPQVSSIDIGATFGPKALKWFKANHYLAPILYLK